MHPIDSETLVTLYDLYMQISAEDLSNIKVYVTTTRTKARLLDQTDQPHPSRSE